ncbi:SdpI family protein [Candidatus Kuenenbacteria bacterium]|nr:SdpI family protein [Candidatus Kuenenbacteria bacterium]
MKNPLAPNIKTEIVPIFFIVVGLILSVYFYSHFPERVATHWNISGEVDGWSSRGFSAFFFPALNLAIYLLMIGLPSLDPRRGNYENFRTAYHVIKGALVVFLSLIYFVVGLNGLGYKIPVGTIIPIGIGVLFVVIGYFLNHVKQNWFLGIRTPWTLSSESVWQKTHHFASRIFMFCGVLMAVCGFYPSFFWPAMIAILALMVFGTIVYSYLVFRKEKDH